MLNKKEKQEENQVLDIVTASLEDGKAEDMVVIDLRGKTSIANEMVVASGTSDRHVISLAQRVQENLKAAGYKSVSEGETRGDWVLIDAYDVIVHIFRPEVRDFYNLEKCGLRWPTCARNKLLFEKPASKTPVFDKGLTNRERPVSNLTVVYDYRIFIAFGEPKTAF